MVEMWFASVLGVPKINTKVDPFCVGAKVSDVQNQQQEAEVPAEAETAAESEDR